MRPVQKASSTSRLDHVLTVGLQQVAIGAKNVDYISEWRSPEMRLAETIVQYMYEYGVYPGAPLYVIDGANIFYNSEQIYEKAKPFVAKVATSNKNQRSVVVVVTSFVNMKWTVTPNMQQVKKVLYPLHGNVYPIFFVDIGIKNCNRGETRCIQRIKDVKPSQCTYRIDDDSVGPEHKYCEFDDVLLSRLGTTFFNEGYKVVTVSRDRNLVKEPDDIADVSSELAKMGESVTIALSIEETNK